MGKPPPTPLETFLPSPQTFGPQLVTLLIHSILIEFLLCIQPHARLEDDNWEQGRHSSSPFVWGLQSSEGGTGAFVN